MSLQATLPLHLGLRESPRPNYFCFVPLCLASFCFLSIIYYTHLTSHLNLHHQPTIQNSTRTIARPSSQTPTSSASGSDGQGLIPEVQVAPVLRNGGAEKSVRASGQNTNHEVFHSKEIFLEDYNEMNRSFKIYVYPHSKNDAFAHAFLPVNFEPSGNYASESYFKKVLMRSHFITKDPSEADLFFLPFSIARLRHDRRIGVGGIPDFIQTYISNIIHKYPYWNQSGGADHFYVACHSTGRSAMTKADEIKYNAIQVVCSSSYFLSGYIPHKDASIPQIWPRKGTPPNISSSRRKKLAFFAGAVNSAVRKKLVEAWRNDSEMSVHFGRLSSSYADALLGSKYCLHVKGFEVNTARIADAIYYGCVPVIIANHYDLPFADVLNWKSFSVVVATLDIPLLKEVLHRITLEEYMMLQTNVMKVRKHFRWNVYPQDYDAFYMVMYELWLRQSVVRFPLDGYSTSGKHGRNT